MEKKNINWGELGFSYQQTEKRFVANFKDGAWDEGTLTEDATITHERVCRCISVCTDMF